MALPDDGPCQPWVTWAEVTSCTGVNLDSVAPEARDGIMAQASDILYGLTERRYPGECETTRSICQPCGCARSGCRGCGPFARVDLGGLWPVSDVVEVVLDGTPLDRAGHWRVDDWRWLVRTDGLTWPTTSDLTDPEGFQVTWVYGRVPPPSLRRAAALLAAEIATACVPGATCKLPSRVTTITREGVSYTVLDSQKFIDEGRTGIYLVDMAIAAAKRGRKARPRILVPGCGTRRVATGTDDGGS